jgi:hypothetical protein
MTDDLRDAIVDDVTSVVNYDPRLIAESILVDEYEQGIIVEVRLFYRNSNETETLKFLFDQSQNNVYVRS